FMTPSPFLQKYEAVKNGQVGGECLSAFRGATRTQALGKLREKLANAAQEGQILLAPGPVKPNTGMLNIFREYKKNIHTWPKGIHRLSDEERSLPYYYYALVLSEDNLSASHMFGKIYTREPKLDDADMNFEDYF